MANGKNKISIIAHPFFLLMAKNRNTKHGEIVNPIRTISHLLCQYHKLSSLQNIGNNNLQQE